MATQGTHKAGTAPATTGAASASATPAADTAQATEGTTAKRAPAANFLAIVRGRLPMIFVHAIRFDKVVSAMPKKDAATKFATSVGKVFDIQKGRNFAYIGESFKPSNDDVAAAKAWIESAGQANAKGVTAQGDKSLMQSVLDQYVKRGLATAEDAAALATAKGTVRAANTAAKPAGEAKSDGAKVQTGAAASGAALLS